MLHILFKKYDFAWDSIEYIPIANAIMQLMSTRETMPDNYTVTSTGIHFLIGRAGDINARDCAGQTRLHLICERFEVSVEIVRYFIHAIAKNSVGRTPLTLYTRI